MKKDLSISRNRYLFVLFGLFVIYSIVISFFPLDTFDIGITRNIQTVNNQFFTKIMWLVSLIGNQPIMILLVATSTLILFFYGLRKEAVISSLSTAVSVLSGTLVKVLIDRPRPTPVQVNVYVWLSDKSYPSGHVLAFTVFFGFLLYLLMRLTKRSYSQIILTIIFVFLIASIGISRIYLGAHWFTDVFGGYLLGIIWLLITIRFYNSHHGKR